MSTDAQTGDQAGQQRDQAATHRDQAADQRDRAADQHDHAVTRSPAHANAGFITDALDRSALARGEAASDRAQALQDRRAAAGERRHAELDRHTALADLAASAREREEHLAAVEVLAAARDAASESSRLKSEFMATISHEIRTPMNGVIGLTSLLLETDLDEQQRQYAEGVRGAGEALLAIINDILDFSKLEAGKLALDVADFDVVGVVEAAAGLVAEEAKRKGLRLDVSCDPTLPTSLRGDAGRIRQIALNLAANAVKFTERGEVVLRVRTVSEAEGAVVIRLEVADTGIGIAETDRLGIFEPFRQADASTTRRFGGTGLGLAISSQLVAAMGGEIGVESEPGRGSTFWCTLVLGRGTETRLPPPAAEPGVVAPGARTEVLVVEDDAVNQLVMVATLRKLGYHSDVAANGAEALEALGRAEYAAILMDCQMPVMDGYAATAAIRRRPGAPGRTPIIAVTAGAMGYDREKCLAAGMDDYVAKPFTIQGIDAVLAQWIGARSAASSAN
jgi:two-component system, sensor histidine kinase and response regulator